ncbi:MAG: ribosome-associated ATPase/putative transporter RbbA [Alphaproteobacteria bacterium]|nr:ribosome-associated ATPase/putative transporter RbbA [Alphaproteobacteria bacterium]
MNAQEPPVITLSHVKHRYGKTRALDDITLAIPAGKSVGFIGPDGVGKSTLFGLVAGSRKIQRGHIQVLGEDIGNARKRKDLLPRIAYMPQGLGKNLYMDLTVFENLDFFARLFGQGKAERKARIESLLKATGLDPFPDRPAGQLSGGMKQKLGLCCALIHDPDLLILDEPTTGVDPLSRRQFWDLIRSIREDRPQMSVLIATAYMEEAEQFDWLIAMDDGKILDQGTADEIKEKTGKDTLEAAFVALVDGGDAKARPRLDVPPYSDGHGEPPVIITKDLTRKFGEFTAVDHVSVEIRPGEIFGFLGSNGCGKTTTMKMLTGLLPATSGEAKIFGQTPSAGDMAFRQRVGYMSQAFSLYTELSVLQNLDLHARLFHVPKDKIKARIGELLTRFGLQAYKNSLPDSLPLGVRQRLSLAVAVVHEPEMLILDEPTSGVDPVARDEFWALLIDLSRNKKTTIFISTHFMNEGMRCDRITLMNAGKVLACDAPAKLIQEKGKKTLEEAFIAYMEEAEADKPVQASKLTAPDSAALADKVSEERSPAALQAVRRITAYTMRETKELSRDRIRQAFAFFGTMILMFVFGFGITFDVENLTFAVLDRDKTPESRLYVQGLEGSRYFTEKSPLTGHADMDHRLKSGKITLAVEIPPDFGEDLLRGKSPDVAVWVDGAMPFRGETAGGYMQGLHYEFIQRLYRDYYGENTSLSPVTIEPRYRYNQGFKSVVAIVPSVIALMLIFIPAILTALSVVREKELGSITNLYVTPVSKFEFFLGKQIPYIGITMFNFLILVLTAWIVFGVPVKGSVLALCLGALLYGGCTTALGLLFSTFTGTQIAALSVTALMTMLPAVQFSGLMQPVSTLEGVGVFIGKIYPTTHFITITKGAFAKDLGFSELWPSIQALLISWPLILAVAVLLLKKQER